MVITKDENGFQVKHYDGKVVLGSVLHIGDGNIVLPSNITHIQISSFAGSNGIKSVTIQEHVKEIKCGAFRHCTELEKIIVSPNNKYFESDAKGVLFTKGRDWLVCAPAKFSGLYVVPAGVKHIDREAFKDCGGITTLMMAQTVTSIGKGAFQNCTGLVHLIIPKNVKKIETAAFAGCSQLCGITVAAENEHYKSDIFGVLFSKDGTRLLWAPPALKGFYHIPEGVRIVEASAFCGCKDLERVSVPKSVESIAIDAFQGCSGLRAFVVSPDNGNYSSDGCGVLLNKDQREILLAPAGLTGCYIMPDHVCWIGPDAFKACQKLTEIQVSVPQKNFTWHMFDDCKNLKVKIFRDYRGLWYDESAREIIRVRKDIQIAALLNYVEKIDEEAFADCQHLTEVFIPKAMKQIGCDAFRGCCALEKFIVSEKNEIFLADEAGALYQRVNRNIVLVRVPPALGPDYRVPDGVTHIADGALADCANVINMILPRTIFAIAQDAFRGCTGLEKIAMPVVPYGCRTDMFQDSPNLTIYGREGGMAENFAKMAGYPFKPANIEKILARYSAKIS